MNTNGLRKLKSIAWLVSLAVCWFPVKTSAEDIDIFVGSSAGTSANPNVLIVLDNTSNWARQSQQWPGGEQQGQSEVAAIKEVVQSLSSNVNVGLMEFVTGGNANDNGGYIRYAVRSMSDTNKTSFSAILDTIYANVTSPDEKRNSGTAYGNLMYDVRNYFAGTNQSQGGEGTLSTLADSAGYSSTYGTFASPLSCSTSCAKNFVIFVSNPDASGPTHDDSPNTPNNTTNLAAIGGNTSQLGLPTLVTTTTTSQSTIGTTTTCATATDCASNVTTYAASLASTCSDTSTYAGGCSCGTAQSSLSSCPSGTLRYGVTRSIPKDTVVSSWTTRDCYASVATPGTTAPSGFPTTNGNNKETDSCSSGTYNYFSAKAGPGSGSCKDKYTYTVQCKQTSASSPATLGYTSSCYASQAACSTSDYATSCTSPYSCTCNSADTVSSFSCPSGQSLFSVLGNSQTTSVTPTGTYSTDTAPYNADEWSRFLYQNGISFTSCDNQTVTTYTIDVYNKQPNTTHTSLMYSMARNGGGKYFNAQNKSMLVNALKQIFQEIQSVNSTFASASLPINATNRSQNENQVFIGMFRPDPDANPRWFGNVKRYQLISSGGSLDLGDINGDLAINNNTGFITDCATSWWTSDSPNSYGKTDNSGYWSSYTINPTPAGTCPTTSFSAFSDSPDGPRVEKGAVAEVVRKGNNPTTTDTTPTWSDNRVLYTASGTTLQTFDTTNTGLSSTLVNWVRGRDTEDENGNGALGSQIPTANSLETRASLHGDVVHSRPLPINYGGSNGVVVYYGANDGVLRAVDASNGKEKWGFIAPEFNSKLDRLRTQSPLVSYPGITGTPTPTKRDYFWDGSLGLYQNADNSKVWIFPTMRRGGRMVYAMDVSDPSNPTIKWKFGCPDLTDNNSCVSNTTGVSVDNIGQTWAIPNVAYVKGYSTSTPAVVIGGGYDSCEDDDSATPSCSSTTGNVVYVLDGNTGSVIRSFATLRSVPSDVALIDMDFDGLVDYAYVGDTGGNVYRISFSSYNSSTNTYTALPSTSWSIQRIAYTTGSGRKFLFTPALFGGGGKVLMALGTGDREHPLETNYPYTHFSSSSPELWNRFYVYRDCQSSTTDSDHALTGGTNLDDTTKMNASSATAPASCTAAKISMDCSATTNVGWYIDLNNGAGEQTVTSAVISGGMVTFSTNRPIPTTAGTCGTPLGEARGYWLDLYTGSGAIGVTGSCGGTASTTFVGGGLPPSPVIGTVSINGVPQSVLIGAVQKSGGASSPIAPQKAVSTNLPSRKRVYQFIKGTD